MFSSRSANIFVLQYLEGPMDRKTCTRCHQEKPLEEFYNSSSSRDGKKSWCRSCHCDDTRQYAKAHPDMVRRTRIKADRKRETCVDCGRSKRVAERTTNGPICRSCYGKRHKEQCHLCDNVRSVIRRLPDGSPLCSSCHKKTKPRDICGICGKESMIEGRLNGAPVCKACRRRMSLTAVFSRAKRGALRLNHEWLLTKEEFGHLVSSKCHYCGDGPDSLHGFIGVDRINNAVGYIVENCVPCCWPCNRAKGPSGYDEYIARCRKVAEHHP